MRPLFQPLLAGATLRDRLIASLGALLGILVTAWVCMRAFPAGPLPLLVAPMGASAVLVFAVPASPLAQPWPVIGGNILSAIVGVIAARTIASPEWAAGVAVGGAILLMSLLRCLHPPGGAAALTAVIGGPAVTAAGFGFALVPVGVNAVILTLAGLVFHRLSGHSYPHRAVVPPARAVEVERIDIDCALEDAGETFDIDPDDLALLFRRAERHAAERRRG